jgi:competence protein ComEC
MKNPRPLLFLGLVLFIGISIFVWMQVRHGDGEELRISFLDVGQGDAIFIESPTGMQVLIDGGRDRSVLRQLGKEMGPLDRSIDIVIATHPDADHIGGLPEVFKRYKITAYLEPGIENDTSQTDALIAAVSSEPSVTKSIANRGNRISIGGGAYLDILYPDRDVPAIETNTGSIILRLVYGETEFMLTGDAPLTVEEWLVRLDVADGEAYSLSSDVLKAGHHGSRTSTGDAWLLAIDPQLVVVSAGRGNSYGHPHEEVVERALSSGAQLLSTIDSGTIHLVSDGRTVSLD